MLGAIHTKPNVLHLLIGEAGRQNKQGGKKTGNNGYNQTNGQQNLFFKKSKKNKIWYYCLKP